MQIYHCSGSSTRMKGQLLLTLAATLLSSSGGTEQLSPELKMMSSKPTTCVYERAYEMYGVHCADLKLTTVPKNLKTGIEILDASDNKIRELLNDTFSSYTSVRLLYLEDNSIYIIEPEAFTPLTYMEILDLSKNAITSIPNSLFRLPSLRKLDLSGNALIYWESDLVNLQKPIKAPLDDLSISDCKLRMLPNLGILPQLKLYNISDNPLDRILTDRFSETCTLTRVDISRSIDNIPLCSLKPVVQWFSTHHVNFILEDYARLNGNEFHNCPDVRIDDENLNKTYNECKSFVVPGVLNRSTRQTWITITSGLAGFLVAFILLLYLMHRVNVAQTSKARKNRQTAVEECGSSKKARENLLSNVS